MHAKTMALLLIAALTTCSAHAAPQGLTIPTVQKKDIICFALYTVHDNTLKLNAQLYPLDENDDRTVRLEVERAGRWQQIATAKVIEQGWTAPFRVEDWDDTQGVPYRVLHGKEATFQGLVRRNPVDKEEIVVAGFTGNSIHAGHGGDISRQDLIDNVKTIDADLLFFSGDQVYDHNRHYAAWLKFGRDFREIIKDRPTITIPDDHDVGQANLWGEGGIQSHTGAGHDGGYFKSAEYVKEVERAQTSHLPDPFDPTPIAQGIGVYYTNLNWGRVSFAILEDRKFKTGPSGRVPKQGPRPDHIRNPDYDPASVDVEGAILLGERQLKFLDQWGRDWTDADFKVALSQTIFCGGAHIHGGAGGRLHADMDSNGWPQTGRNKAIDALRKAFALHYAGDQHLATVFHHGIDEFRDANVSFCVPSIANLYLRWWDPLEPGANRAEGAPAYTGDHLDGFANKVTCYAAANPEKKPNGGTKLTTRAAGFGVVRLNKSTRKIKLICWPRNVDVSDPSAKPYPGWPITIDQQDNYGRKAVAWLPTLRIDTPNQVVEIVEEATGTTVYTLRINGKTFSPKVFAKGAYTIKVGEGDSVKTLNGIKATDTRDEQTLRVAK
ncbi:MAG: alkaline phosphatase D family protein [Thermoguttaceae bacterium]